jgi:ADP-ribosylglycohydrolase
MSLVSFELVSTSSQKSRSYGALLGLAIGDALGMPTQSLSFEEIREQFHKVKTFNEPSARHPYAAGLKAGMVTDDTEQSLLVASLLTRNKGEFDQLEFARQLLSWEDSIRERGLLDLLGPSTKAALANLQAGMDVSLTGREGTTNGAAMRISPVGILCSSSNLDGLVRKVIEVSMLTHNTASALGAAAGVAGVISGSIDGLSPSDAVTLGIEAAELASMHGAQDGGEIVKRIKRAVEIAGTGDVEQLRKEIGTSVKANESVPCAIGLFVIHQSDPWEGCCTAASIGDDTDTIAAITGSMLGAACGPERFPPSAVNTVETLNALNLRGVAEDLAALRH